MTPFKPRFPAAGSGSGAGGVGRGCGPSASTASPLARTSLMNLWLTPVPSRVARPIELPMLLDQ